jgi:hypothetical protein
MTIAVSLVFGIGFSLVAYCYLSVYKTFSNAIHMQKKVTASHIQKERRVFYMCLVLTGSFLILWTPSLINVSYELISGVPLHSDWAVIPSFTSSIPSATNSMVLLYFDNRIRGNVMKFFSQFQKASSEVDSVPKFEVSDQNNLQVKDHEQSVIPETGTRLIK